MNTLTIIAVASGGALGAVLRLIISTTVNKHYTSILPFGTLMVNLLGAFFIGLLFAYFHLHETLSSTLKSFMITGILGALTTYSTFAMESFLLLHDAHYLQAFANMALNLFGTILLAGLGYQFMLHLSK